MALRVVLNKEPYIGMLLEAGQAYHRETFGLVLGTHTKKDNSFNYDTKTKLFVPVKTRARYTRIEVISDGWEKVVSFIPSNSIKLIGDFHTHTRYGIDLSEEDISDMEKQKSKYYLSFVMHLSYTESKSKGFLVKNDEIIYIHDIYSKRSKNKKTRIKTRLAVFYLDKVNGKLKPIKAELEPSEELAHLIKENKLNGKKKNSNITLEMRV